MSTEANIVAQGHAIADAQLGNNVRVRFEHAAPDLNFDSERRYLLQLMQRNPALAAAAAQSPNSLATALLDAAAMGLTLSPTLGLMYLKPQAPSKDAPKEVVAVPSYKGLETVALRGNGITGITTELVYSNDKFQRGVTIDGPVLAFDMALGDRGDLLGGFCLTRFANGERHVEWMPVTDLEACQVAAMNAAGGKLPPSWRGPFADEMRKKCIVRRAAKHWALANTGGMSAVLAAVDREVNLPDINDGEGEPKVCIGDADIAKIREALAELEEPEQDLWMKRKAEAMGYASIRDVPADQTEAVCTSLRLRLDNVLAAKQRPKAVTKHAPDPILQPQVAAKVPDAVPAPDLKDELDKAAARRRRRG